jgi:hypothetical protein
VSIRGFPRHPIGHTINDISESFIELLLRRSHRRRQFKTGDPAAKKLAIRLSSIGSADLRILLNSLLQRVLIRNDSIQMEIRRSSLRELIEADGIVADTLIGRPKSSDANAIICLTVEAKRKLYGGEIHLIAPPNSNVSVRQPTPAPIKAVVRGHAWHRKVLDGEVADMESLVRQLGLRLATSGTFWLALSSHLTSSKRS